MNLRIPGPTPCPQPVLQATARQMIDHRGKGFAQILGKVTSRLKELFHTQGDVLILTGSGTGGMEAAVVNCLSPGDQVLSVSNGFFGDRFADMAEAFGARVKRLEFPWGSAVDPEAVRQELKGHPDHKAVLVTHNETSTGVTNDLEAISGVVREQGQLLLVDAISSIGSLPCPMDAWGLDVVVTASQKGWMAPPGLAMVGLGPRAWQAVEQARMPRCYWDFKTARRFLERNQTPWTPAVSTFYALEVALDLMAQEGQENVWARHRRVGQRAREGVKALGLSLFPEEKVASNTVTAVRIPPGVEAARLLQSLRDEHATVLSGGQDRLAGQIFRIGHLGYVTEADIDATLEALRQALPKAGYALPKTARTRG